MLTPQQLQTRLSHTWPLFFARHGRFFPVQLQAIPPILEGHETLVIAATASGKTEAVIAPLLERNWKNLQSPISNLSILYICPTRALVRDLFERLREPLADSGITLAMKTGDVVLPRQTPALLLTTPESTDALLTRTPKLFRNLQAIVLDEIHLFDNSPRGDHMRCLLNRITRIQQYNRPSAKLAQRVALSATVPDPAGVAQRYLQNETIIQVSGGRVIEAEIRPLYDLTELVDALAQRPSQKSLIFCNSRTEVEQTAAYLRQHLPHHADIFVHYSNLDAAMRIDVETRFAAAATAVCVSTSTLELGIDIGSVDDVVLLGAPLDLTSFMQRIGRGSRRREQTRVLCLPKSPGEWARFEALLALAKSEEQSDSRGQSPISSLQSPIYSFRPSVLIQQIFSLTKQSPTGSVRRADVRRMAPPEVSETEIGAILSQLTFSGYLQSGRLGEWKPDLKLQEMLDRHEIYSNIGADALTATAVDAFSSKVIAQTERVYAPGTVVLFGGQPMRVVWQQGLRFGLAPAPGESADEMLRFAKSYAAVPFDVTQAVARLLELKRGQMAILTQEPGIWLFHFWGTVWGMLLTAVLRAHGFSAEVGNEYCLYVRLPLTQLPLWDDKKGEQAVRDTAVSLGNRLEMGRFHSLLPIDIALTAVLRQINLPAFAQAYQSATLLNDPELHQQLHSLLSGS
jgi:ATP-dependent Lhr-like helicase